jgi:hypothetical protein
MRKVSMNEQQFERFITENAIRVAQRYLMETADMGADFESMEEEENFDAPDGFRGDDEEEFYADDLEEGADSEDFDEERFDIYVNGECRYRDVDSSLAYSILGQFGPNDDVEVKRVGEDDFED